MNTSGKHTASPPALADRLLAWLVAPHLLEVIQGDLHEEFEFQVGQVGERKVRWFYWWEVLGFIKPRFVKRKSNHLSHNITIHYMLRNYLLIAFRNFLKHKVFSMINLAGVAVGLACFLIIALYVKDETSFDRYNSKADRIYRVSRTFLSDGAVVLKLAQLAPPFGPAMAQNFPEIEQMVRTLSSSSRLQYGDHVYNEENMYFAEPNIFKVFDIKVLSGHHDQVLVNPFSIMLSRPMAEKYFGKQNPVGNTLKMEGNFELLVTGVFEPLPAQAHFHPSFLVSFSTLRDNRVFGTDQLLNDWDSNNFNTYLLLKPGVDDRQLEAALPAFQDKTLPGNNKPSVWSILNLQKVTDIHLHSQTDSEVEPTSDFRYVLLFSIVGLFILLIACINYMNLATARFAGRSKEVGMRKAVGALRSQLIMQFLSESLLLVLLASGIALLLAYLCLPLINNFTQKQLSLLQLLDPSFLAMLFGVILATGLVSGSYPAFFLTSFRPIDVLKGQVASTMRSGGMRKILVVTQFTIAIVLITSTIIAYKQMKYVQHYRLGYSKDQVLITSGDGDAKTNYDALRQQLIQTGVVEDLGRSSRVPSVRLLDSRDARTIKGGKMGPADINLRSLEIDYDFIPAYQIKMAAGRNFSRSNPTDTSMIVLNERAVRLLGWTPEEAIGKPFQYGNTRGQVIGVTKDFHFESLHQKMSAVGMTLQRGSLRWLSIPLKGDVPDAIAKVEAVWKQFFPGRPFDYQFLDERFQKLYVREQTQQILFGIFAGIAILISCLGLFGLAMFMAEQRTKEIGVRKVLGASLASLVSLFSIDFLKPVLVAIVIATPIAWYIMQKWLSDFAYRTGVPWWIFPLAGGLTIMIALITVSLQSLKVAMMNPVKSLKSE